MRSLLTEGLGATLYSLDIWGIDQLLVFVPIALLDTVFLVAGGASAINIVYGFNGLAASVTVIMSIGFAVLAW